MAEDHPKPAEIILHHKDCSPSSQDAYHAPLRSQVHGASKDANHLCKRVLETEMNSSTNIPSLLFRGCASFSSGNFHGQPLPRLVFLASPSLNFPHLGTGGSERLVNPNLSGLPAFLVSSGGLNSGSDHRPVHGRGAGLGKQDTLSPGLCCDSHTNIGEQGDHVSMGPIAARKCREIRVERRTRDRIELLLRRPGHEISSTNMRPGEGTYAALPDHPGRCLPYGTGSRASDGHREGVEAPP